MLGLSKKLKKDPADGGSGSDENKDQEKDKKSGEGESSNEDATKTNHKAVNVAARKLAKLAMRDSLLFKEVQELQNTLPPQCKLDWKDENVLSEFDITINPDEGHWKNGSFKFHATVPVEYNMAPPKIKCNTRLWHPNITEGGDVCLSILRQSSIDEQGWAPTRSLKDVVWGVNSLFTDLLNFDDPLNGDAAKSFKESPADFGKKVREYIRKYCEAVPAANNVGRLIEDDEEDYGQNYEDDEDY